MGVLAALAIRAAAEAAGVAAATGLELALALGAALGAVPVPVARLGAAALLLAVAAGRWAASTVFVVPAA